MDTIRVVCGIIFNAENRVFISRRNLNKSLGGFWEFPGGKIEKRESNEEALHRELLEELGMNVKVLEHFITNVHDYGNFQIELISYRCIFIDADFHMTDHDAFEWVDLNDLIMFNLAPADIPIVNELITNYTGDLKS